MRSSFVRALAASSLAFVAATNAHAGVLQWGTTFSAGNNTIAPTTGTWSTAANWTYRSGTDLGTTGVPDAGDVAQIGFTDNALTLTVDGTYDLLRLDVRPRTSGFSGRNVTLNSSSGLLRIGANGVLIDNGGLLSVNVPIQLTADQTFSGGTNNPGGIANFGTTISGNFKITRSATNGSTFQFFAGNSTFNGFAQASQTTRIGNSSSPSAAGGGPLGSGVLELTGGTLTSDGTTARTISNSTELRGNINLGASSTNTGTLTFATTWAGSTFRLHSATNDVSRTITNNSAVVINHGIGEAGGGSGLGLTKAGTSNLTLNGTNAYTGPTSVSAGTLTLNGSLATAKVAVSGGTFTGTGTLNYNLDNDAGDLINLTGGVFNLTALKLALDLTGTQSLFEYVIANAPVGSPRVTGTQFALVTGLPDGATIDYDGTPSNPNAIVLVVPEPTGLAAAGLMGLAVALRRKRRA